jgi:hypothetical protein
MTMNREAFFLCRSLYRMKRKSETLPLASEARPAYRAGADYDVDDNGCAPERPQR